MFQGNVEFSPVAHLIWVSILVEKEISRTQYMLRLWMSDVLKRNSFLSVAKSPPYRCSSQALPGPNSWSNRSSGHVQKTNKKKGGKLQNNPFKQNKLNQKSKTSQKTKESKNSALMCQSSTPGVLTDIHLDTTWTISWEWLWPPKQHPWRLTLQNIEKKRAKPSKI